MTQFNDGISVIITAHAEGNLAHRAIRSVLRAAEVAQAQVPVEVVAVLDTPTPETQAYFDSHASQFAQILCVNFQDEGQARQHAIGRAHGRYVTLLNSADLISGNWLLAAFQQALTIDDRRAVFHPELCFHFGRQPRIFENVGYGNAATSASNLLESDCWSGHTFVTREFACEVPFASSKSGGGWGHTAWHWNCEAIAAGGTHHVVPGTVDFVREQLAATHDARSADALLPPTRLFDQCEVSQPQSANVLRTPRQSILNQIARSVRTSVRAQLQDRPRLRDMARRVSSALQVLKDARQAIAAPAGRSEALPEWLVNEWRTLHDIEPALLPTSDHGAQIPRVRPSASTIAGVYSQAAAAWQRDRTHVFLLPWLKRGGSDLVVLHQMRALAELGCDRQLCVTTEACDSPWLAELPPRTDVLELGKLAAHLPDEAQLTLLARLLVQRSPSHVHCINSALGLKLFARHGKALSSASRLFASMWCPDYSVDGYAGYAYEYLFDIFPHLTNVFCDHSRFVDELVEKYDFDRARFQVLDFPTRVTVRPRRSENDARLHVLWASRLDRQKRPDVLLKVIEACRTLPVHFHVYGAPALEANRYSAQLRACVNVTYHGEYDGFSSLPTERFDALLYTTAWDGLPNVLLEAMGAGLACVAPDVGGISELISAQNGYLVGRTDAVDEYARVLGELCQNRERVAELRRLGPEYIAAYRNWPRFVEQVRSNCHYAPPTAAMACVAA
ncbi:MAG TPA: glycosyltransferase [Pirellulales bacterium]|jgi:glycosyltransferase involved in cell wall biosynthesis